MAWVLVARDVVEKRLVMTNSIGNVAEVIYDENATPRWTLKYRSMGGTPESFAQADAIVAQSIEGGDN